MPQLGFEGPTSQVPQHPGEILVGLDVRQVTVWADESGQDVALRDSSETALPRMRMPKPKSFRGAGELSLSGIGIIDPISRWSDDGGANFDD